MKKKKIKLLQLINGFGIGGAERKLLELVQFLDREQFNVVVAAVGQGGPLQPDFETAADETYIVEKKHKFDFSQVFKVASILKKHEIDIVQNTMFYADIIGTLAAKFAKTPHVVSWEVSSHPDESHESKFRHIFSYRMAMKQTSKIVSVSDAVKDWLIQDRLIPDDKIQTIRYGIDLAKFNGHFNPNLRKEIGVAPDDLVIGTVARFTNQKGHTYLLDAAPRIVEKFPKAHFLFLGDGPLKSELQEKAKRLKLEKHIHFLGFRDNVSQWLNAFDIFLLPSLFEGLPNAVLEAMACARPVVATAVDGTPEAVVDQETGLLIQPKVPEDIASAIIKLLEDENLRKKMGAAGRKRIETDFTNEMQFTKFEELYKSLMN